MKARNPNAKLTAIAMVPDSEKAIIKDYVLGEENQLRAGGEMIRDKEREGDGGARGPYERNVAGVV